MGKVVYADVLFLLNFGGDILTVLITARLCRMIVKPLRALVGTAVCAVLSVLISLLSDGFVSFALGVPVAVLMCITVFGKKPFPELLRLTAVLWSSSCLLFGVLTSLRTAADSVLNANGRIGAAVACAAGIPAVLAVSRFRRDRSEKKSAIVDFTVCGSTVKILCLVDSGNVLREPISGDPVLFVASAAAPQLPDDVVAYLLTGSGDPPPGIAHRLRIIPAKTLTGEEMLRAVRPDGLSVNGTARRAFVSLRDVKKGSFGSYDGVVPQSIAQH